MAARQNTIEFGETRIAFTIRRSEQRKTVGITITADGNVEVLAPRGLLTTRIAEAVREKGGWIVRKLDERRQFSRVSPPALVSGESIRYLGRQHLLRLGPGASPRAELNFSGGRMEIRVPHDWPEKERAAAANNALRDWYRSRLEHVVVPLANRIAARIGEPFFGIRIRELGHRWGSSGKGRTLYFNWRLAMAPTVLIEYVVAHELCHLRHQNHSRDFYRLLARILPDWEARQERLDREGPAFDLK